MSGENTRSGHRAKSSGRRRRGQRRGFPGLRLRHLRTIGIGALLATMVLAFMIVLAFQADVFGSKSPASSGPDRVALASRRPADVLTAARATRLYRDTVASSQSLLGQQLQHGTLGTPVLVHVYHPLSGMHDVWVVPVLAASVPGLNTPGPHVVALLDFADDPAHQAIQATSFAGPFVPGDPEYGQPFPRLSAQQAIAAFTQARGLQVASGGQPQLIYFPADLNALVGPHPTRTWSGGGQFPDLAIWRVPGADGQDYFVGLDGNVYTSAQLPLAPGAGQ